MESFAEVIDWERQDSEGSSGTGVWQGRVPATWMQGRTSFGGLTAALGLQAVRAVEADGRRPRSVHVSFFGPVGPEVARLTAQVVRRGGYLTHARAEIEQEGSSRVQVMVTLADARESDVEVQATSTSSWPDPAKMQEVPFIEGVTPAFVRQFALCWARGGVPYSGGRDPRLAGFCRHRSDPGHDPYVALLALIDAWPSPFITMMKRPTPNSSVTWTTNFVHVPEVIEPDAWWWYESEGVAAHDGHGVMRAALYGADGRLAATVEQLVAWFDRPAT